MIMGLTGCEKKDMGYTQISMQEAVAMMATEENYIILDEILEELKIAMREKDELKKNTITMLRAAILQIEKDNQKTLFDEEMQVPYNHVCRWNVGLAVV